jgi:hypothetical protein
MSAFEGKADVNHCVDECPFIAISGQSYFRYRHPERRTAFALGAAGGCGGGLRLLHGGPAPGRARSGAGRARAGLGGGIGYRWQNPSPHLSKFSNRCQGHPRLQARGGGLCGGTPPCRRFRRPGRTAKNNRRPVGRVCQHPSERRSPSHRRPIFSVPCYPGVTRTPFPVGTPRLNR